MFTVSFFLRLTVKICQLLHLTAKLFHCLWLTVNKAIETTMSRGKQNKYQVNNLNTF